MKHTTPAKSPSERSDSAKDVAARARSHAARDEAQRHALRADDTHAFVPDPSKGDGRVDDDLAEELGEGFLTAATLGQESGQEALDAVVDEELGGPFLETDGEQQFAAGTDRSNPRDAERAAFPTANADRHR